jgi:hypothetical protein
MRRRPPPTPAACRSRTAFASPSRDCGPSASPGSACSSSPVRAARRVWLLPSHTHGRSSVPPGRSDDAEDAGRSPRTRRRLARNAEELPQRKAVAAPPDDAARVDPCKVADEQHAEIDAGRNAGTSLTDRVVRFAQRLDEGVEPRLREADSAAHRTRAAELGPRHATPPTAHAAVLSSAGTRPSLSSSLRRSGSTPSRETEDTESASPGGVSAGAFSPGY